MDKVNVGQVISDWADKKTAEFIDPIQILIEMVERDERSLQSYAKTPAANEESIHKWCSKLQKLKEVVRILEEMLPLEIWHLITKEVNNRKANCDGIMLKIPLKVNVKDNRLLFLDLTRMV